MAGALEQLSAPPSSTSMLQDGQPPLTTVKPGAWRSSPSCNFSLRPPLVVDGDVPDVATPSHVGLDADAEATIENTAVLHPDVAHAALLVQK